jgi:hypothetical protein
MHSVSHAAGQTNGSLDLALCGGGCAGESAGRLTYVHESKVIDGNNWINWTSVTSDADNFQLSSTLCHVRHMMFPLCILPNTSNII